MNSHNIIIVTSREHFDNIFGEFKESAKINSNPEIFLTGLDTEFITKSNNVASFSKCSSWTLKADKIAVCKLQLATGKMCLVIDLCKFETLLPDNLIKLLTSESWLKSGIGISHDLSYLSYNFNLGQCNGGIEMKTYADLCCIKNPSLTELYKMVTGKKISKTRDKTNEIDWATGLTVEQIEYAAMDAIMSHEIGKYFAEDIVNKLVKFKSNNVSNCKNEEPSLIISTKFVEKNYIGELQEYAQKKYLKLPVYEEITPDKEYCSKYSLDIKNCKQFNISCLFNDKHSFGFGDTKKQAKTMAAKNMLESLKNVQNNITCA